MKTKSNMKADPTTQKIKAIVGSYASSGWNDGITLRNAAPQICQDVIDYKCETEAFAAYNDAHAAGRIQGLLLKKKQYRTC
jgi:hypothetical protein